MHSLEQLQQLFKKESGKVSLRNEPDSLYRPMRYMLGLGGKHLRPALLLASNQLSGGDVRKAMPAAVAVEFFHNFTLMHDDIMDEAPRRRGKLSVPRKFGISTAILSGDALFVEAYRQLSRLPVYEQPVIFEMFSQMASQVCRGQQLDMDYEKRKKVSVENYMEMITLKTAALPGFAMFMGSWLAEKNLSKAKEMFGVGLCIGLGFQLMDDWLDTFGKANKTGKKNGGDILRNKKTYLLTAATETGSAVQRKILAALEKETNAKRKIAETKTIFRELKVDEHCLDLVRHYHNEATGILDSISAAEKRKTPFRQIIETLELREV